MIIRVIQGVLYAAFLTCGSISDIRTVQSKRAYRAM